MWPHARCGEARIGRGKAREERSGAVEHDIEDKAAASVVDAGHDPTDSTGCRARHRRPRANHAGQSCSRSSAAYQGGVRYIDRADAGVAVARLLTAYRTGPPVRVLGIARGGVAVAAPIARELHRPLDVLVIRKLGLPWAPEVAFGAIGPYGVDIRAVEAEAHLSVAEADGIATRARVEVDRQVEAYRHGRSPLDLTGEIAILVDDGLATGATAQAAVALARELRAARAVVAYPSAPSGRSATFGSSPMRWCAPSCRACSTP